MFFSQKNFNVPFSNFILQFYLLMKSQKHSQSFFGYQDQFQAEIKRRKAMYKYNYNFVLICLLLVIIGLSWMRFEFYQSNPNNVPKIIQKQVLVYPVQANIDNDNHVDMTKNQKALSQTTIKGQSNEIAKNTIIKQNDNKVNNIKINEVPIKEKIKGINDNNINSILIPKPNDEPVIQNKIRKPIRKRKKSNDYPVDASEKPQVISKIKLQTSIIQAGISQQSYKRAVEYIHLGLQHRSQKLIEQEKVYMENKYKISTTTSQLSICVVLPSYNNAMNERYKFNLKTVFDQEYNNYHIVYIDDGSTDNTSKLVEEYLKSEAIDPAKYTIITNKERKGALYSERKAAKQICKPYDIYFLIDGDDGLVGTQVFKLYNHLYQQNNYWFIYGNFIKTQYGVVGPSRQIDPQFIDNAKYRKQADKYNWPISHLKTFYNKLFLQVPQADLMYPNSNDYFDSSTDRAIVYPMLQIMKDHSKLYYLPEIVYLYNDQTQLSVGKVNRKNQVKNLDIITSFQIKDQLECLFKDQNTNTCIEPRKYSIEQNKSIQTTTPN